MKKSLMVSVAAAALLATTGFATAQGMSQGGSKDAPSSTASPRGEAASPRSESSNPAAGSSMTKESAAPSTSKESAAPEMKNGAAPKSGSMAQDKSAQEKSGATDTKSGTKAMPQQAQEQTKEKAGTATDTRTSGAMNNDSKSKASESKASESKASESKASESKASESGAAAGTAKPATADSKTGDTKSTTTTGNAATSATAAPPAEKQTQIVSAIKQEKVEEVTNVNFSISVGARVPATVHYHPLPSRIVEIYPEWRGYDFIFVHGRYIILRPETHEIIYIIES